MFRIMRRILLSYKVRIRCNVIHMSSVDSYTKIAFMANADSSGITKTHSKVIPKAAIKDTRSFEDIGLKTCTTEADEEDAIA
jgi:hypothetical protein